MIANTGLFDLKSIKLFDVLVVLFFFIALSSSTKDSYLYITMGMCIIILTCLCYKSHFIIKLNDKRLLCVMYFVAYITITGYPVGGAFYTAKKVGAAIIEFTPILLFNYYKKEQNKRSRRFVVTCLLFIVVYYMIMAYYTYTSIGVSARRMANHTGDYGDLAIGGGYSLAYAVSLLSVYIIDSLKNNRIKGKYSIFINLCIAVMAALVIYETLSTITLLAYMVGVGSTLFIPSIEADGNRRNDYAKIVLTILFLLLAALSCSSLIGEMLIKMSENNDTTMGARLFDLGTMLTGQGDGDYALGRMSIPIKAFNTFLKNPFFGISYLHGNGFFKPTLFGAGNHCEWIDALCNYGIIGGIPFLYIYYSTIKQIYEEQKGKIGIGLFMTLFIMGFFNPFRCVQSNTILIFLIPLLCIDQTSQRRY